MPPLEESTDDFALCYFQSAPGDVTPPQMAKRDLVVSSKGNVTATFQVPGLISVPTDNESHNVTISELKLDANHVLGSSSEERSKSSSNGLFSFKP